MRKIIAYESLDTLQKSQVYPKIRNGLQIAVSKELSKKMTDGDYFPACRLFTELMRRIYSYWTNDEHRIRCLALISSFFREKIGSSSDNEKILWLTGCRKKSFLFWSSITLLEEAGVSPEDISPDSRELQILVEVWKYLVDHDEGFNTFRSRMTPDYAVPILRKTISGWMNEKGIESNVVTIHWFYYLTPIQERLIRLICKAGFEVYFLIPYRSKHPFAHQIWTDYYCSQHGYPTQSEWIKETGGDANSFGEILEGRTPKAMDCKLVEYKDIMSFVYDLDSDSNTFTLYSADPTGANDLIQSFFPERYEKRKLSSYPIGGFIEALHSMWDWDTRSLRLTVDSLFDCLASGWVSYKGFTSDVILKDFDRVSLFFKDCQTIKEWTDRLQLLRQIHVDVVSEFVSNNDDPKIRRFENILGNPFLNFSIFSIPLERVELIIGLIENLIDIAKKLFDDGSPRGIKEHTDRLIHLLQTNCSTVGQKNELDQLKNILDRVLKINDVVKYDLSDLVDAILSFISNESLQNDGGDKNGWVRPLYEIGGNKGNSHVCFCSEENIPGKKNDYVWPLTNDVIEKLIRQQRETDEHPLINNVKFITKTGSILKRFLLYSAFDHGTVTLSWVNDDGKLHSPSPYISLISKATSIKIEKRGNAIDNSGFGNESYSGRPLLKPFELRTSITEEIWDLNTCPRRYMYGYLLAENPSFSSEFHYSFAIGGLIESIKKIHENGGYSSKYIEEQVFELFPYLRDVEKRNITDRSQNNISTNCSLYHGKRYTDMRLGIHFPAPLLKKIEESMETVSRQTDLLHVVPNVTSCRYCPHKEYCLRSINGEDSDEN